MYEKSTRALNKIRGLIFSYPPEKEDQADRVLDYLKSRKMRSNNKPKVVGEYSGLTRQELKRTGTCETDWY